MGKPNKNKLDQYVELKKELDAAVQKSQRLDGAIEQLKEEAIEEFGVEGIDDLEELLKNLEQEEAKIQRQLEKELGSFEKKYGKHLEEMGS